MCGLRVSPFLQRCSVGQRAARFVNGEAAPPPDGPIQRPLSQTTVERARRSVHKGVSIVQNGAPPEGGLARKPSRFLNKMRVATTYPASRQNWQGAIMNEA